MKLLIPLVAASMANAHTIFTHVVANGKNYGQGNGVRIPSYNGPIEDVSSNSLACNGNPNPTASTPTIIDVKAGDEITAVWRYMLSTTGTSPADIMDSSHKGPILAYMKKVNNAASDSGVVSAFSRTWLSKDHASCVYLQLGRCSRGRILISQVAVSQSETQG
jgi:hypothetical protein